MEDSKENIHVDIGAERDKVWLQRVATCKEILRYPTKHGHQKLSTFSFSSYCSHCS